MNHIDAFYAKIQQMEKEYNLRDADKREIRSVDSKDTTFSSFFKMTREKYSFFHRIAMMIPEDIFHAEIEENDFCFYSGMETGIRLASYCHTVKSDIDFNEIKSQYKLNMKKSKQKTIFLTEKDGQAESGLLYSCFIAEHPMPKNHLINLVVQYKIEKVDLFFIFTTQNKNNQEFIALFMDIIDTAITK